MRRYIQPSELTVRPEAPADIRAIREVTTAAFGGPDEARLVDRLRADGDATISLVAVLEGDVVGHVLFSPMAAPFRALALAPVSVMPKLQRFGLGRELIKVGLERATTEGWDAVFVLGDPRYYARFGFAAVTAAGFTSPYAGPHFMALALREPLPYTTGPLDHAPAFAALG